MVRVMAGDANLCTQVAHGEIEVLGVACEHLPAIQANKKSASTAAPRLKSTRPQAVELA